MLEISYNEEAIEAFCAVLEVSVADSFPCRLSVAVEIYQIERQEMNKSENSATLKTNHVYSPEFDTPDKIEPYQPSQPTTSSGAETVVYTPGKKRVRLNDSNG